MADLDYVESQLRDIGRHTEVTCKQLEQIGIV